MIKITLAENDPGSRCKNLLVDVQKIIMEDRFTLDDPMDGEMVEEEVKLEVTRAVLMKSGDVILSPRPVGAGRFLFIGLPMAGFGLYAILMGMELAFIGLFALIFGALLTYVGLAGLSGPVIKFDITGKQIEIKKKGASVSKVQSIDAICQKIGQPFSISGLGQMGMGIVRARLALDNGDSIRLFTTGNRHGAVTVAQWINNALEIATA